MTSLGWTVVGFVGGVATSSAAFLAAPAFVDVPLSPVATVDQQTNPVETPVENVRADAPPRAVLLHPPSGPVPPNMVVDDRPFELIGADPLGELDVLQRVAMLRWMAANPQYEFITRDYCRCHDYPKTICPEFEAVRIRAQSDYPYTSAHDYNGDGKGDFAIMVALKGKEGPDRLLIFNGPFGDNVPTPAFDEGGWQRQDHVRGTYVGVSESDNGYKIKRKGATYELTYVGNPG